MKTVLIACIVLVTTACSPPGWVRMGSESDGFKVADSVFVPIMANGEVVAGDILIADQPNLCETARSGFLPARMKAVAIRVARLELGRYLAPDVGTYEVIADAPTKPGNYALVRRLQSDLNCKQTLSDRDASFNVGTVTIEGFDPTRRQQVGGKFDAVGSEPLGDSFIVTNFVEGAFTADYCSISMEKVGCR